jgi:hypothetical protein
MQTTIRTLFIHVGFPKTGTTFLQKHLFDNHSEINNIFSNSAPLQNESLKDFLKLLVVTNDTDFDTRIKYFKKEAQKIDLVSDKINLLSYEVFTSGIDNFELDIFKTFERIKTVFCNDDIRCKVFFTIRNQPQYIVSRYAQGSIKFESEKKEWASFSNFLKYFDSIEERGACTKSSKFFDTIKYNNIYLGLSKIFGKDNVKVFIYEKLKNNQVKFISEMSQYFLINVDEAIALTMNKKENTTKETKKGLYKRKFTSSLFFTVTESAVYREFIRPNMPKFLIKIFKLLLMAPDLLIQISRKPFMDDIVLSEYQYKLITEYYNQDNKQLNKALDLDLDELGYF